MKVIAFPTRPLPPPPPATHPCKLFAQLEDCNLSLKLNPSYIKAITRRAECLIQVCLLCIGPVECLTQVRPLMQAAAAAPLIGPQAGDRLPLLYRGTRAAAPAAGIPLIIRRHRTKPRVAAWLQAALL